ncbi:MAG: ATP-dependent DNA helicase RecQ [Deltaproteobacteria bacterium]|nr:ATP-dependent DNA helicase RecQ [Deltaproteobacteria bacterium]
MNSGYKFTRRQVYSALKNYFGYDEFRDGQADIVREILKGRDLFTVMPTGGGKSLCYQLPSILLDGVTVVISPLISLMKDQVDSANANGIGAAFLNSSIDFDEQRATVSDVINGKVSLLYVAPERISSPGFINLLGSLKIALFAIDEAHCISQWGHDFRPDYMEISTVTSMFPHAPVASFTATATRKVQDDIIDRLVLREPFISRHSFDRPNLFIETRPKKSVVKQLIHEVEVRKNQPGIIYRTTRKDVEKTALELTAHNIKCVPYHAGLIKEEREKNQDLFNNDKVDVVVATIAFGMGIDKSNIRYVLHGDLPKNIEGYYQEIGRAGRDGERAECIMFYGRGDISRIKYFLDQMENSKERSFQLKALYKMYDLAESNDCRRKSILNYFDEEYTVKNCGNCDVCSGTLKRTAKKKLEKVKAENSDKSSSFDVKSYDSALFEELRSVRLLIARSSKVPPFVVFSDATLIDMAIKKPATPNEFLNIKGVGVIKYKKYGTIFLKVIKEFQ